MSKCTCGYECRLTGEEEMRERFGCAKTIERREQPFNNLIVTMCSREEGSWTSPADQVEDNTAFTEAFKKKYNKDGQA